MDDIIEISTYPGKSHNIYKAPHCGIKVDIKGDSYAAIRLTKRMDDDDGFYWIVIANNRTYIQKHEGDGQVVHTPNILSDDEYRSFWISWKGLSIRMGRDGEVDPIVTMGEINAQQFNYVLFTVKGGFSPVHWRFELPPVIQKNKRIPVTDGDVRWVRAGNPLPDGALIGGYENGPLYIIRAAHYNSLCPGKFVHSQIVAYIPWGLGAREITSFEVLVGFNVTWVPTRDDLIPVGAVVGGHVGESGEKLYIGRVNHKGHIITGKVQPSHSACFIPYNGREIAYKYFEILVVSDIHARNNNKVILFTENISSPQYNFNEEQ